MIIVLIVTVIIMIITIILTIQLMIMITIVEEHTLGSISVQLAGNRSPLQAWLRVYHHYH